MPRNVISPTRPHPTPTPRNTDVRGKKCTKTRCAYRTCVQKPNKELQNPGESLGKTHDCSVDYITLYPLNNLSQCPCISIYQRKLGSNFPSYGWLLPGEGWKGDFASHNTINSMKRWCEILHHITMHSIEWWCEVLHHTAISSMKGGVRFDIM